MVALALADRLWPSSLELASQATLRAEMANLDPRTNGPKLHHYVPKFHLRRFADPKGRLWVWDKTADRVFPSAPGGIAAETQFYRLTQYEVLGHDPLTMETQLSALEGEVAKI